MKMNKAIFLKKGLSLIITLLLISGCTHTYQVSKKISLQHQIKPNVNALKASGGSPVEQVGVQAKYKF